MINKIATFLLLVSLIGLGLSQRLLASGVSNTVGVKSAFELLCQNGATFVAGGAVNKKALRTEAVADIGTLAWVLGKRTWLRAGVPRWSSGPTQPPSRNSKRAI